MRHCILAVLVVVPLTTACVAAPDLNPLPPGDDTGAAEAPPSAEPSSVPAPASTDGRDAAPPAPKHDKDDDDKSDDD